MGLFRRKDGASAESVVPAWLVRRVPVLRWLPAYTSDLAVADLVSGITLGLTMMPQSIAYAQLAGVKPEYGLYSAFAGGIAYMLLGTIKQVVIGPASIMSIVTLQFTRDKPVTFVHLLTFFTGLVQFAMTVLRLGFLVDFISMPVVSAFTSATAIIIMVAQLPPLLGVYVRGHGCVDTLLQLGRRVSEVRPGDAGLGFASIAFLLAFKGLSLVRVDPARRLGRALWFLSISKNAFCITAASVVAFLLASRPAEGETVVPFAVVGYMTPGLPAVTLPPFGGTTAGNATYSFVDMTAELGVGIVVTPVVGVLVNIAIAKAYATSSMSGALDASQEMLSLASCNLVGSLLQAMPVSGALTRSAVAEASGVRTPLAGAYCSLLIVGALAWLTPYFYFIPRPTLAAVLIVAVGSLVDAAIVPRLWRTSKRDLAVLVATFLTCLWLGVEVGLVVGMLLDATRLLQPWTTPAVADTARQSEDGAEYVLVRPSLGLLYPGVEALRQHASGTAKGLGRGELPVVLDFSAVVTLDYSGASALVALAKELQQGGQRLLLTGTRPGARAKLVGAGFDVEAFCEEDALASTLRALRRDGVDGLPSARSPLLAGEAVVHAKEAPGT
ncbi:sodium-independent sulfate anion transporter-like [Thrips palmi]|uniref:Sodium-independent sulfate anion transporter-like n=1 Tax=Thrips palmi TaxID=161013 RepID=A0A6P8YS48_THRPL|nr:sodium-independent sulfate anion transporter-like [Thrips palmi]